jgi:hypothetical protein
MLGVVKVTCCFEVLLEREDVVGSCQGFKKERKLINNK